MVALVFSFLAHLITGAGWYSALAAFGEPPANAGARRYRVAAFCLLLTGAALVLTAAFVESFAQARDASEVFGWSGLVCLELCVICGIRYASVNRTANRTASAMLRLIFQAPPPAASDP
jgi:hypothetical protein